jgi:hypothetical protein
MEGGKEEDRKGSEGEGGEKRCRLATNILIVVYSG